MKAIEILAEDYKSAATKFTSQGGEKNAVDAAIKQYRELLSRNQIRDTNQKQIDWWAKQGWPAFSEFLQGFKGHVTPTQVKRRKLVGDSIVLKETNDWLVVIPLDKEASCFHGKHSDWCVTKPHEHHWEDYFHDSKVTLIYALGKHNQGMWALAVHEGGDIEIFDQKDASRTQEDFERATGFNAERLSDEALQTHGQRIRRAQVSPLESVNAWFTGGSGTRSADIERDVLRTNDPSIAVRYMYEVTKTQGPQAWPENLLRLAFTMYVPSDQPDDDVHDEDWEDPRDDMKFKWGRRLKELMSTINRIPASVEEIIIKHQPDLEQFVKSPSHEFIQRIALRSKQAFEKYYEQGKLDDQTILKGVSANPYRLAIIKDPGEELQLAAMNGSMFRQVVPEIIKLIKDPSEAVQMAAITRNIDALTSIKNPTKKVIFSAIEKDPNIISRLDPNLVDEEVLRKAFATNWVSSQYLPRDQDGKRISIPPRAQMELAKSFFRQYLGYGDSMQNKTYRTSMLKYNYPQVEELMTDDKAKRFLAALRKKYERD